jgi:hypothetical protein
VGADEDDPRRVQEHRRADERLHKFLVQAQLDIRATPVALGPDPPYNTCLLQHPEVMSEQIGRDIESDRQLTW